MSIKNFGIFLAYPPAVNLKNEGLGRHLASFLRGAAERKDIRFTIVCPSWSVKGILDLCESENVPKDSYDIVSPSGYNILLKIYECIKKFTNRPKIRKVRGLWLQQLYLKSRDWMLKKISSTRNPTIVLLLTIPLLICLTVDALFYTLYHIPFFVRVYGAKISKNLRLPNFSIRKKIDHLLKRPKDSSFVFELFQNMHRSEINLMLQLIDNKLSHLQAWYCPTAFWPEFNKINAPKLVCLPDIVLADFPVGFSTIGRDRTLQAFNNVEKTIRTSQHLITYSNYVKNNTLVNRYNICPSQITVIPHAANDLFPWLDIQGYDTLQDASLRFAQSQFNSALKKM